MYIVVGANGFLGSYTLRSIVNSTDEKIIATFHSKEEALFPDRVEWTSLDITDINSIRNLRSIQQENTPDVKYAADLMLI